MDKSRATLPMLLTADDAADLLRTTRRAVYQWWNAANCRA